ncbi:MAG: hypothetical protein ACLQU4_13945 [Limisphaerales bacterium]
MSLINDALRRASQTERNRPRRDSTATGMEPAPPASTSRLTLFLAAAGLVAVLLAAWAFWRLSHPGNNPASAVAVANVAPAAPLHVNPTVVAPPKVAPIPLVGEANPRPATPAPAPVAATPTPVSTPAPAPAAPPAAAPAEPPSPPNETPVIWPVELKLSAIFFNKTNPKALINGDLYIVGDQFHGVVVKKIEKDEVTVEWNGHSKVLMLGGD